MIAVEDQMAVFVRQITKRSNEHRRAMELLANARLAGQMVAVLRQELDSMVRVIYLLRQSSERRALLIEAAVSGHKWTQDNSRATVTDKEMVDLSQELQGWTRSVYRFGCSFIHLSMMHDYSDRDPLLLLPVEDRVSILEHCRYYHGGPMESDAGFAELIPFLPRALKKVADNLGGYLGVLVRGELLDPDEG